MKIIFSILFIIIFLFNLSVAISHIVLSSIKPKVTAISIMENDISSLTIIVNKTHKIYKLYPRLKGIDIIEIK